MAVTRADARELWKILADGHWRKQSDISIDGPKVRDICQEFAPWFISNTAQGYKLTRYATEEEIQHSINDLRSRSEKMLNRAAKLEKYLRDQHQEGMFDDSKPRTNPDNSMAGVPDVPDDRDDPGPTHRTTERELTQEELALPRPERVRAELLRSVGLHPTSRSCADCGAAGKVGDLQPTWTPTATVWKCEPCRRKSLEELAQRRKAMGADK